MVGSNRFEGQCRKSCGVCSGPRQSAAGGDGFVPDHPQARLAAQAASKALVQVRGLGFGCRITGYFCASQAAVAEFPYYLLSNA